MLHIGIDPGLSGAIAAIDNATVIAIWDMPVTAKLHGSGNMVDARRLFGMLLAGMNGISCDFATWHIEAVSAMPKQGVTSVFGFGHTAGVIEGVVAALGGPRHYWRPQQWKKPAGISGKDKDAARTLASRLYPNAADALARKKDDGRAEAILIAHYGQLLAKGEK
jgi:crossover junction endodeoxyribonuclease RuvC